MKILHVWNIAGVASILAKYQAKLLRWKTWVITRRAYDRYGLTIYGEALNVSAKVFKFKTLLMSRKYDIIHVHSLDEIIPILKLLYPKKKVIIHYHGTDTRGKWKERKNYWEKADRVLVSTPDLLQGAPNHVIYLPNPVDTELFKPMPELRRPRTALYFIKHQEGENNIRRFPLK